MSDIQTPPCSPSTAAELPESENAPTMEELKLEIERLNALLAEKTENTITDQLWLWVLDCKMRRNAYWKQFYRYQKYNNILSTPLTLIASATGITSIAQLGYENSAIQISVAVLGVLSTALTAYQRYFNWGEKALHCREIAKRYTILARKAEMQANLYQNSRITLDVLQEFMETFRKELDVIQTETEELPAEILNRKFTANPELNAEQLRRSAMNDMSDDEDVERGRVNGRRIMFSKAIK
jgi:hypothetical protein